MTRRRRVRRLLKWGATLAAFVIAVCAVIAALWTNYGFWFQGVKFEFSGGAMVIQGLGPEAHKYPVFGVFENGPCRSTARMRALWSTYAGWPRGAPGAFSLPLWLPFACAAASASLLWWRDRRVAAGHCPRCGYNLTGNVSGVCPECGTPATRAGGNA
jgi:hypothetical protein